MASNILTRMGVNMNAIRDQICAEIFSIKINLHKSTQLKKDITRAVESALSNKSVNTLRSISIRAVSRLNTSAISDYLPQTLVEEILKVPDVWLHLCDWVNVENSLGGSCSYYDFDDRSFEVAPIKLTSTPPTWFKEGFPNVFSLIGTDRLMRSICFVSGYSTMLSNIWPPVRIMSDTDAKVRAGFHNAVRHYCETRTRLAFDDDLD